MKFTIEGTPQEIASFLDQRIAPGSSTSFHSVAEIPATDPKDKPPIQTIEPGAIEREQFGSIGDGEAEGYASVQRRIDTLVKMPSVQKDARDRLEMTSAFESDMQLARRFIAAECVRDGRFQTDRFDLLCHRYFLPDADRKVTFEGCSS